MTANDYAGLILSGLTIAGILFAALRWLIQVETAKTLQKEVPALVKAELHIVNHELQNNGGSSTKDKIDFIFKYIKDKEHGTEI